MYPNIREYTPRFHGIFTLMITIIIVFAALLLMFVVLEVATARHLGPSGVELGAPVPGSKFIYAIPKDAIGLDPSLVTDGNSFQVTGQIYDTLIKVEPGGTTPIPDLAESWVVSSDGITWTFNIRSGVKFHDGTDLDAAAVAYNFDRWWDESHPQHVGSFEYFEFMFNGFKGNPDCLISNLIISGTHQFQIVLSRPYSPLPNTLAMPSFGIASPAAIALGALDTNPVGTSAFKFHSWVADDYIRLSANTTYWGTGPVLETLEFKVIDNDDDLLTAISADTIQGGQLNWSHVTTATMDTNLKVVWHPSLTVGYMGINRAKTPLNDPLVQLAIAHAVDKGTLVEQVYNDAANGSTVADQLLPPTQWGRDNSIVDYEYDPTEALSLLAQAGYTDGFTTTLWVMPIYRLYNPEPELAAEMIKSDLLAIGITVTLETGYGWSTYLDKVANGEADLFQLGWGSDNGHPDNFFYPNLCYSAARYGPRDDTLCDQLEDAWEEDDYATLEGIYEWASQRVHDTLPLIPIAHARSAVVLRNNVTGYIPPTTGVTSVKDVFYAETPVDEWVQVEGDEVAQLEYTDPNGSTTRKPIAMDYRWLVLPSRSPSR